MPSNQLLRFSDAIIDNYSGFSTELSNNITNISFDYQAKIDPIYIIQTGQNVNNISPSRVSIQERTISTKVTFDNLDYPLLFTGKNYGLKIYFVNPSNTGIQETFSCSGKINQKTIQGSVGKVVESNINIIQQHINNVPSINTTDSNPLLLSIGNNILNITGNDLLNTYEVDIADRQCKINSINSNNINITVPNDVINGNIFVKTTKGIATSSFIQTFNYSGINISNVNPPNGDVGTLIYIRGDNFYRISNVSFSGVAADFMVLGNTGILVIVPPNVLSGPLQVISQQRNITGTSSSGFYTSPTISNLIPSIGMWGDTIEIDGANFTGVSSVLFNNIPSQSFNVIDNNTITAIVPPTGSGYTKGYVTVINSNGLSGVSYNIYQPTVPIYNVYPLTGTANKFYSITTALDSQFLHSVPMLHRTGFLISYYNKTGVVFISGVQQGLIVNLTGLAPTAGRSVSGVIALFEPDGATTYSGFRGQNIQIGPPPIINSISPNILNQYQTYNLSFNGDYLYNFYNQSYYLSIIEDNLYSNSTGIYTYNSISGNTLGTNAIITGFRYTGTQTGWFDVNMYTVAGSGSLSSGLFINNAVNQSRYGSASHPINTTYYNPTYVISNTGQLSQTFSATHPFSGNRSGLWMEQFSSDTTISSLYIYQNTCPATLTINGTGTNLLTTISIEVNDVNNNYLYSGCTSIPTTGYWINQIASPITGARFLRLYASGISNPVSPYYLGFTDVEVY